LAIFLQALVRFFMSAALALCEFRTVQAEKLNVVDQASNEW